MNRRTFIASSSVGIAAAQAPPKKIAAILTEYWLGSHADVVVGKYLEGYNQDDQPPYPRSKIASIFTEHVPDKDMSRERAKKYHVPIFRTVHDALCLGGDRLAVDGVLLIGEHGVYPVNEKLQTLYPRFDMFLKITDVFRESHRSVPVFNDKHLSFDWRQAQRMVAISRELGFPMMAGSSVPGAQRIPAIDAPFGKKQNHAVAISYSGLDIYGFHLLEALQSMTERRQGGETGVRAVQCLQHQACWDFIANNGWVKSLFEQALMRSNTRKAGSPQQLVKEPTVFIVDYVDGLRAAAFLMTGMVEDFTVALDVASESAPVTTLMNLQNFRPHHHFGTLVKNIELMFETGKPTYPVERTMLTSGILDFGLESRFRNYQKLDTPQLAKVRYQTTSASHFSTRGWGPDGKRLD